MILFVRDVPKNLSRRELKMAVQEALRPRIRLPFQDVPAVTKAQFLVIQDNDTGGTERHGLVLVRSGRKDAPVLRKFRRVRLKDRICTVRPYIKRGAQQNPQPYAPRSGLDRQTGDRRRPNIDAEIERKPYIQA
jgi:hypothetical protein